MQLSKVRQSIVEPQPSVGSSARLDGEGLADLELGSRVKKNNRTTWASC
jgi:hypothetical protein